MDITNWIDERLKDVSEKLPQKIHEEPASFACGYNVGYKQAILDLQNFIVHNIEL